MKEIKKIMNCDLRNLMMMLLEDKIDKTLDNLVKEGKVHFNKKTGEYSITKFDEEEVNENA